MNYNTLPHPTDLLYFQEVARTENLSRAAERLGVGQPALSLSLRRLEEQLQSKLFLRRSRGLNLTESGQRLLLSTRALLEAWSNLVTETKKSEASLSGIFRIGCHPTVAQYALPPLLEGFFESFPAIELQLDHGLSRQVTESVISGKVEFGIVVNPLRHPDLVIRNLGKDTVALWQSKNADTSTLLLHPDLLQTQSIVKSLKRKFTRQIASSSLETLASLAASGRGLAILPTRVVEILAPDLKRVAEAPVFHDTICFVFRADLPKTASVKALLNFFQKVKL